MQEYADWLDAKDLLWPAAPKVEPVKATAYTKPLDGVRGVAWSLYGTLLFIADGKLVLMHNQQLRMQIALEKTIQEFNMWNSMSRKPGAPWEYMLSQYTRLVEDKELGAGPRPGEKPEVNAADIWSKLIDRLGRKEYSYDEEFYGDIDELAEKVAYFFHSCLQGVGASPNALAGLNAVAEAGFTQGIVGDGQVFSLVQLLRCLRKQGPTPAVAHFFSPSCIALSYEVGAKHPSPSLMHTCVQQFAAQGIKPREIVCISSRLRDELALAKKAGMRTALFAGDKNSLQATPSDIKDSDLRPDRILTDAGQVRQILGLE